MIDNDHSPERDTSGEVLHEDSPLKRVQATQAKPLPPPEHNLYLDNSLANKSMYKKRDMDGLDEYYRKVHSLYLSYGRKRQRSVALAIAALSHASQVIQNELEQLTNRYHLFPR